MHPEKSLRLEHLATAIVSWNTVSEVGDRNWSWRKSGATFLLKDLIKA